MMQVEYINPFIEAVYDVFGRMLEAKATRGEAGLTEKARDPDEITAIIGWSGQVRGTVSVGFPVATALNVASRLAGSKLTEVDDTVMDAVAETVNIIGGGAKAKFADDAGIETIDLSLPMVVFGANYDVQHPTGSKWVEVPFDSELGSFTLCVTFETMNKTR